jgi:hypothetical protein
MVHGARGMVLKEPLKFIPINSLHAPCAMPTMGFYFAAAIQMLILLIAVI